MKTTLVTVCLAIMICTTCAAAQLELPPLVVPDCLGINIHFAGRETAQVDRIAAAGFKFIRMDFMWDVIEKKKGEYNYKPWDELTDSLASKGIRPIYILDYGNPIYENATPPFDDESRAAFATFAGAAAAHYKGKGVIWEIYNEPNGAWFWKNPNAEDYVKLAKAISTAIKKADPDSIVIGPATCGVPYGYIEKAFKLGLLDYIDAVSVHPYGCWNPENANRLYVWLHRKISQYGPKDRDIPIISGEWGFPTHNGGVCIPDQARFLVRMFLNNMMNGCRLSVWYDWHDGGTDPNEKEHNFGILYNDYKEKPSYIAMQTLSEQLNGYSFVRRISTGTYSDYVVLFRKGNDYRIAAWTTMNDPHTISIPIDVSSVDIVSLTGEKKFLKVKDKFDIELSVSPQYVKPSTPSRMWASAIKWNQAK